MAVVVSRKFITRSALLALLFLSLGLAGCRSDRVSVDKNDPYSPKYAYRKDELALLQMSADDIQELERRKQYGTIYDDYASQLFRKNIGRRQFLIMANCVESFLGDLEEYDRNDIGFRREDSKDKSGQGKDGQSFVDVLNRKVQRSLGSIEEQMVFIPDGLGFKLNGLYWISKDKLFLRCIRESGRLDAQTSPQPELPPEPKEAGKEETAAKTDESAQSSESTASKPKETTSADKTEQKPVAATTGESGAQAPVPTGGLGSLESKPVQTMKPSEIKKEPLKARPAGAGAVVDQRPTPKKTSEQKKAEEEAAKRRTEPPEQTDTVPLPSTGGSGD